MKKTYTHLPDASGVYFFKNDLNQIIYIGKAKALKKRVQSYFVNQDKDWKIKMLIAEYQSIDCIVTKTEHEALLLEAQLVKENQPKFNVLLKSGQPFVYLLFSEDPVAQLLLVRNKKQKGTYFGPFLNKKQARSLYEYIMTTFRLYWCKQKIEHGCLKYHLNLCAGNCRADFDKEEYNFRMHLAQQLLKNQYKRSLKEIEQRMHIFAQQFEFEKAKHMQEYLQNLATIDAALKAKLSKYDAAVVNATLGEVHQQENAQLAVALQEFITTEKPLQTIDCFDISHFQSNALVGSCVRFTHGIPDKNYCRRFKIRSLKEQNDYAALQEIVMRRYKDLTTLPDLIVIDGGKGQWNAIKALELPTTVVSLAKREERLFAESFPEGKILNIATPVGKLLIALRDYAHHFAINYHRLKRAQDR